MQFDMKGLSVRFKSVLDFMLAGEHWPKIKGNIESYKKLRDEFSNTLDPRGAFELIVMTKLTNAFYRELSDQKRSDFESDFDSFLDMYRHNTRTPGVIDKLASIIITYSVFPAEERKAKDWVEKLFRYPNLKDFTENLRSLRKNGKKSEILGDKGADHYLRDVGQWDIIPIDIHEKRFLIRTGIFHMFSEAGRQDPLENRSLQDALTRFCSLHLNGKTIERIDLGSAPGIVDLFIWSYCSDERYKICGKVPKCNGCKLEEACFFGVANTQQATSQQRTSVCGAAEPEGAQVSQITPSGEFSRTTDSARLREIRTIKQHLADNHIKDSEEKRLFLKTKDKDVHDWGCYIAGLVLTQSGKTTFGTADVKLELQRLIPEIYDQKYAKQSRIQPPDVRTDAPWKDGNDYANGFPCLERTERNVYRFVGFKEGIRRRYGDDALEKRLSES